LESKHGAGNTKQEKVGKDLLLVSRLMLQQTRGDLTMRQALLWDK